MADDYYENTAAAIIAFRCRMEAKLHALGAALPAREPWDDEITYNNSLLERVEEIEERGYPLDPPGYAARVRELEADGLTTSDAQGVADAEILTHGSFANAKRAKVGRKFVEAGAASITIALSGGRIEVRHGTDGVVLAELDKAPYGTWAAIWANLRALGFEGIGTKD